MLDRFLKTAGQGAATATNPVAGNLRGEDIAYIRRVRSEVNARILDQREVVDGVLAALLCRGHVLIESNPGLGKTSLVKAFSAALGVRAADAGRIQFTPDLLPSDITGTLMRKENGDGLAFTKGPVFKWLLLADEINRASPKTQAAMLEAMAEKQVTVLGKTYALPDGEVFENGVRPPAPAGAESPFMVLATQNPIDHEGTYELPEAQADRFMFKLLMGLPSSASLRRIANGDVAIAAATSAGDGVDQHEGRAKDHRDASAKLARINRAIATVPLAPAAEHHVLNLVQASNANWCEAEGIDSKERDRLKHFVGRYLQYPLGPRAAIALFQGAKAFHVVRDIRKDEVHRLARSVPSADPLWHTFLPALRHRLKFVPDWERLGRQDGLITDGDGEVTARDRLIAAFVILCAPTADDRRGVAAFFADRFGDHRG
jgi:MoxR-like ATPase